MSHRPRTGRPGGIGGGGGPSRRMAGPAEGYQQVMGKPPSELDDDELVSRLKDDVKETRPATPLERNAPVDIEDPPVDLDQDGVA